MPNATLADPTDFGNKPGDGPLRAGGQAATTLPNKDDLPSVRSPASARQQHALGMVRDLWGGTERVREKGTEYLPQAPGEDPQEYRNRLERSVFFNAFRRTVEGLTGLVFRRDPMLGDDVPAPIKEHWENIDNAGTHGDVFCRDLLEDDLTAGHNAILVEYPKVEAQAVGDGRQARLEAEGALRPYWVPIKKEDIMSWWTVVEDGRTYLAQIVLRERRYVRSGMFKQAEQVQYRVIVRAPNRTIVWTLYEINKNEEAVVVDRGVYANQDEIPLAEIRSSGRIDTFESDPPLKDLAYLNVAHYQQQSDYFFSIHKTCVPFLFGAGIDLKDEKGNDVEIVVGPNTSLMMRNHEAKMMYVSHDGASLGSVKSALDDLKSDMGTLGLAMLAPQKRSAETAEAKRLDKATSDSALAVTARGLQDGVERALYFHARYLKLPSGGSVEVNRDFEGLLMDAPVMQAYAALRREGFPAGPILKMLQAGGRIAEDEDLDALELEMEANRLAEEERQRMEAEDRAAALSDGMDDAA